ncbi:MAG: nucleotide exchange factor GrpE [Desulfobacterales bacterium]|nr:MAG: nucleotide exchange factor GrpE [Desulfobacterales bacterium]
MDEAVKEKLVGLFRHYLDTEFTEDPPVGGVDLFSLFNELAGLKNEVKIESRQFKKALDDFRQAFIALDGGQQELVTLLGSLQHQEDNTGREENMILLMGLIDLYDRIGCGLKQAAPAPSLIEKFVPAVKQNRIRLEAHLEGQEMVFNRLVDLLRQSGVMPIKAEGEPFDPKRMKAVGTGFDGTFREGTVIQELRSGFQRDGLIIRLAEVVVNKNEEKE